MKSKRLVILIAIIIVAVLILTTVLLSIFLFRIKHIELNESGLISVLEKKESDIAKKMEMFNRKNILRVSFNDVKNTLEKEFPYIEVTSISRFFPDTLIVNYSERIELFALPYDGGYYLLDKTGRVLKKQNDYVDSYIGEQNNGVQKLVLIQGVSEDEISLLKVGKQFELKNKEKQRIILETADAFLGERSIKGYNETKVQKLLYSINVEAFKTGIVLKGAEEGEGLSIYYTNGNKEIAMQLSYAMGMPFPIDKNNKNFELRLTLEKDGTYGGVITARTEDVEDIGE